MDFRHIDAFRALMLTRTTIKAAQLLAMSQPAVSRLVAELERSIDLTLFNRQHGRLEPTAAAVAFFEEVERRYAGLNALKEFAQGLRDADAMVMRVGSAISFSTGLFAHAIARFREMQPSIKVSLTVGGTQLIHEQVIARNLEFGIVTDTSDVRDVSARSFSRAAPICAIPASNPLAAKRVVALSDLHGQKLIAYEDEAMLRWGIDSLFAQAGLLREVIAVARYSLNICALVKENVGIGLIHPISAYDFLDSGSIVFRRVDVPVQFHALCIKPKRPAAPPQVESLISTLDSSLEILTQKVQAALD